MADSKDQDGHACLQSDKNPVFNIDYVDELLKSFFRFRSIQEVCKANGMYFTDWPDPRTIDDLATQTKIRELCSYGNVCDEIVKHFTDLSEKWNSTHAVEASSDDKEKTAGIQDRRKAFSSKIKQKTEYVSESRMSNKETDKSYNALANYDELKENPLSSNSESKPDSDEIARHHKQKEMEERKMEGVEDVSVLQTKPLALPSNVKSLNDVHVASSDEPLIARKEDKTCDNLAVIECSRTVLPASAEEGQNIEDLDSVLKSAKEGNIPIIDISELSQNDCLETELVGTEHRTPPHLIIRKRGKTRKRRASKVDCRFDDILKKMSNMYIQRDIECTLHKEVVEGCTARNADQNIDRSEDTALQQKEHLNTAYRSDINVKNEKKRVTGKLAFRKRFSKHIRSLISKTKNIGRNFKF